MHKTALTFITSKLPATHFVQKEQPLDDCSVFAPVNIALVKYWGKRDVALNLPQNDSLSIGLKTLGTTTQISPSQTGQHQISLNGEIQNPALSIKQMKKQTNKLENLGSLMNQYQILMQKLGVSDKQTENLLVQLHSNADFFGVKISGSGLGDCLIALGKSQKLYDNQINLNSTSLGAWGAWDT